MNYKKTLNELLSDKVWELLQFIEEEGFLLTLVGGAVRELMLHGTMAKDLDFEIRKELSLEPFLKELEQLFTKIEKKFDISFESLPFSIYKINYDGFDLEFASPRTEVFTEKKEIGHKNFKAVIDPLHDYECSFARRDFTVNAMGIEFSRDDTSWTFIDPLNGIVDLKKSVLKYCGETFFYDPVRFLRMIRFKLKLNATIDPTVEKQLSKFNLLQLTPYYLYKEALKSEFFPFMNDFFHYVELHNIKISDNLLSLKFLERFKDKDFKYDNLKQVLISIVFEKKINCSQEELYSFCDYFGIKRGAIKSLYDFRNMLDSYDASLPNKLKDEMDLDNIEAVLSNEYLKLFLQMHNLLKKAYIDLRSNLHFTDSSVSEKLSHFVLIFPEKLSGKAMFQKIIKTGRIKSCDYSKVRLIAHLVEHSR